MSENPLTKPLWVVKVKVKVKFNLEQATKTTEWRNGSVLSLTSVLDGVGGQRHAPAALPPGKTFHYICFI
jgi:hypothetical protein